jgi:hypothetical protein
MVDSGLEQKENKQFRTSIASGDKVASTRWDAH